MLHDPLLAAVLAASPLAYIVVTSPAGPLITRVRCTARDDRLRVVVPRSSATITTIGLDAPIGVTLTTDTAAAVFQGEARVVDAPDPRTVLVDVRPERYLPVDDLHGRRALVGCETPRGPVALPAAWHAATRTATIAADLVSGTAARTDGRICIELDANDAVYAKAGFALGGQSARGEAIGDDVTLVLETHRVTWWRGDRTETTLRGAAV